MLVKRFNFIQLFEINQSESKSLSLTLNKSIKTK